MSRQPGSASDLVARIAGWIERLFPDERGQPLAAALTGRFGGDDRELTAAVCREVEAVAQRFSRHFELEYVADGSLAVDGEAPGWPPPDAGEVRSRAAQVREVRRTDDGIGLLALDGLDDVRLAAPYLEAAFELLRGVSAVVLDLRRNGGGDPGTLTLVLGWMLGGGPAHVSDVRYRDRVRQWWTPGRPEGAALPAHTAVAVLVGDRTYSSGEALAYHLQSRGRATIVGRATPGAADHVTPIRLMPHVRGLLPEAVVVDAVTGGNWEGTGVAPDVACDAGEALAAALDALGSR